MRTGTKAGSPKSFININMCCLTSTCTCNMCSNMCGAQVTNNNYHVSTQSPASKVAGSKTSLPSRVDYDWSWLMIKKMTTTHKYSPTQGSFHLKYIGMCQSDLENNQGRTQGGQNDLIVHDGGLRPTAGSTLEKIALILLRLFRGERKKNPAPANAAGSCRKSTQGGGGQMHVLNYG